MCVTLEHVEARASRRQQHGVARLRQCRCGARGFFERRGFVAQQRNTVFLGDEWLANTTMVKPLAAKDGTSGDGKESAS